MKFTIAFKWNRDEAYEAMNDDALNETARTLYTSMMNEQITCESIRTMNHTLLQKNEMLAIEKLQEFMKADYEGLPRYIRYVQDILTYGVYGEHPEHNPSKFVEFINSFEIVSEEYGINVEFTIPSEFYIDDWDHNTYVTEMDSFKGGLSDGMWEGMPGSLGVHESCSTVSYNVW